MASKQLRTNAFIYSSQAAHFLVMFPAGRMEAIDFVATPSASDAPQPNNTHIHIHLCALMHFSAFRSVILYALVLLCATRTHTYTNTRTHAHTMTCPTTVTQRQQLSAMVKGGEYSPKRQDNKLNMLCTGVVVTISACKCCCYCIATRGCRQHILFTTNVQKL